MDREFPFSVVSVTNGKAGGRRCVEQPQPKPKTRKLPPSEVSCECDHLAAVTTESSLRDCGDYIQDEIVVLPTGVEVTEDALGFAVRPNEAVHVWVTKGKTKVRFRLYMSLNDVESAIDDDEFKGHETIYILRSYVPWNAKYALVVDL